MTQHSRLAPPPRKPDLEPKPITEKTGNRKFLEAFFGLPWSEIKGRQPLDTEGEPPVSEGDVRRPSVERTPRRGPAAELK